MVIDFSKIEPEALANFMGGEKQYVTRRVVDGKNKIMYGTLAPGASIGVHTHTDTCEMMYILEGVATYITDGVEETVPAGQCNYCPKGSTHTMRNNGTSDLKFFAVVSG